MKEKESRDFMQTYNREVLNSHHVAGLGLKGKNKPEDVH